MTCHGQVSQGTTRSRGCLFGMLAFAALGVVADVQIVVPPQADRTIRIAAEEFQKYHEAVTGCRPPVTEIPAKGSACVKIGFPSDDPLFAGETDAYIVKSAGGGLEIVGKNSRSVLYGVYEFFRQRCGCRWFWDGDVVSKAGKIDFAGVDIREKAQFLYRGCQYFAHRGLTRFHAEQWGWEEWRKELDWCVKNRLNVFLMHFGKEDLFQCAYPDLVPYPDPSVTEPCDSPSGYDMRTPFWSLQFKHLLRKTVLAYARERGLIHPEKIGPMTHWFFRTPPEFLAAKKPAFMPQIDRRYSQPSGLMWDIRQQKWFDEYWNVTEGAVKAYGEPGMFFNPGFDERTVYSNRADNVALKIDVIRRYNAESHRRRPDAPVVMEGWDFFMSWKPDELQALVQALDPAYSIVWDFTGDIAYDFQAYPWMPKRNAFTGWGVVKKFPYTFGMMLAFNRCMDIRGQYATIREREKAIADDPMCKGYLIWPETSHSDIFAWRYFTDNCWRLSPKTTEELLADFCRDRYGAQAAAFEAVWRKLIPVSQLWGWSRNCVDMIAGDAPHRRNAADRWKSAETPPVLATVPDIFAALADINWEGDFVRRDAIDLARTALDRAIWFAYEEMLKSYHLCAAGKADAAEVKAKAERCTALVRVFADVLALHTDFSLAESLDRLDAVEKIRNPEFERIFFENSACGYCRSHQAEYARGWYLPATEQLAALLTTRAAAKDFSPLPALTDFCEELRKRAHPIRDFAPIPAHRTAEEFRRLMCTAAKL